MEWNPQQYDKFRSAREQPFADVVALIQPDGVARVVDLGCGPGNLTIKLAERFANAQVIGLDSSAPMLQQANERTAPNLRFQQASIEEFADGRALDGSFDVIFSNAALHWVPDHKALVPKLMARLSPRGQLAVQLPSDDYNSTRKIFADVAGWRHEMATLDIAEYAQLLYAAGSADPIVFEKIYPHILPDADAVLEWAKGTALLPYLERLVSAPQGTHEQSQSSGGRTAQQAYLEEVRRRLHARYPERPVLFPFRRIIFYARRA